MLPITTVRACVCVVVVALYIAFLPPCLADELAFHVFPTAHWAGPPSAPYRDPATQIIHLYMLYNPNTTDAASTAWYHVTSADYLRWTRVAPSTAMTGNAWYDSHAVLSGVLMANNESSPVVMYTCATSSSIQQQCMASPATGTAAATIARDYNTFAKSASNPVIAPESVTGIVSHDYFRGPTEWWADPATKGQWLIAFATRVADGSGGSSSSSSSARIVVFATTDPSFQGGYSYSHSLYTNQVGSSTETLEYPDFFNLSQGGERFLKLSLMDLQRDVVLYGTYAAGTNSRQYVFTTQTARRATVVDYGCFYGAKTFYDPVLKTRRMWGWIKEELTAAQLSASTWGGVQTIRSVVYDTREKRLRFPPIDELQQLRASTLVSHTSISVKESTPLAVLTGSSSASPHQEVMATFYVSSVLFDGSRYYAANPPEFGLRVRVSPDASRYVTVSVRMPITNSTPTRGYRQAGKLIKQFAVRDDADTAALCVTACTQLALCEAWNLIANVSGSYCELLSTAEPLQLDCSAQTGRSNVPLLVVDRTASATVGSQTTLSGRAPLTIAHAGYVKLHVYIDGSVLEVYKDDGMEVVSSRVYLGDAGADMTGVSLFARHLQGASSMLADVAVYSMSSVWT